jgi:hypothetical protein
MKDKVESMMNKELDKKKSILSKSEIRPFKDDYHFSTNGIYIFCGRMGSGKSYTIMKHIFMTENMFPEEYYDEIIFTSTSGAFDKTVETLMPKVKGKVQYVEAKDLLEFLNKHLKHKMKFQSFVKYIEDEEVDKTMREIIEKHRLNSIIKGQLRPDPKKMINYIKMKSRKYGFKKFPTNTLLVLDDFAGHKLIKNPNSDLNTLMTKTRHFYLTIILAIQTWTFIPKNIKRISTDIVLYKGYSVDDFVKIITETPGSFNVHSMWDIYSKLDNPHAYIAFHCSTGTFDVSN